MSHVETKHHRIVTPLPAPGTLAILDALRDYEPGTVTTQAPVVWDRAEGYQIFDACGNCWIDFSSGIFVANVGHAHPHVCAALARCIDGKLLHAYLFATEIRTKLAKKLIEMSPSNLTKVCLLSTGSESIEAAMKLARLRGLSMNPQKTVLVSLTGDYHGRTMGSQLLASDESSKAWIVNRDPDIHHLPFPPSNADDVFLQDSLNVLSDSGVKLDCIAAFILESYQSIGGPTFLPDAYVQALRRWASEQGALLIFDEIQSGIGRTGKFFCYEHYKVEADLVCCGKGITSCLPLSVVLGSAELFDMAPPGAFTSTHSGNPMCCAAALATLEVIEQENLLAEAQRKSENFSTRLRSIRARFPDYVHKISGRGMCWSIYFSSPDTGAPDPALGSRITERAIEKGLMLFLTRRDMVKMAPPLTIPDEALGEGLDILLETVGECV